MSHRSWVIGRAADCDLVVAADAVSSRHCRLTEDTSHWLLEDLNSSNGTYVDGVRLPAGRLERVAYRSRVTLGTQVAMPWPEGSASKAAGGPGVFAIHIGRAPESDHLIDLPMISWKHATIFRDGDKLVVEDNGSRNGVAVNRVENRVQRAVIQATDELYLGSYKVAVSELLRDRKTSVGEAATQAVTFAGNELLIGRSPEAGQQLDHPMISMRHAKLTRAADGMYVEDLGSRNGTFVNGTRISTKVKVKPGDQIGLGSFRFQLQDSGAIVRREYHGNVTIEAAGVSVIVANGKRIIEPTSFTIYPSELVALMGPAGAGKTTLLKALNGYTPPAEGKVLFNGSSLYESYDLFRLQMGYVPQDDIVHPQLTVAEALKFSLQLRTDLTDAEIDTRIDKVLSDLGILDKKNTIIGSAENKVLSGGQRKRVNIALELIHDTPVLFLDEPTSGLSSYDAEGVVRLLKRLSTEGKTIITTIHQPSLAVFKDFDNLIMMARDAGGCGALAFFGPAYPDSIHFFNKQPAASDLNPEMLLSGLATRPTVEWQQAYQGSAYRQQFVDERSGTMPVNSGTAPSNNRPRPFDLRQWLALTRRNLTCKLRDRGQMIILAVQAPLFALLVIAVTNPLYVHAGQQLPGEDLSKKLVIMCFLLVVASIWFGCNNAARDIVGEWSVYQRERMVSLKLPSYIFSKLTVLLAIGFFQCIVMLGLVFLILGLKGNFGFELMVLMMSNMIGAAIGLCLSARASTTESAIALLPVVLLPVIALGGGLQPTYRLPAVVQGITTVIPSRWAFEANVADEGTHWELRDRDLEDDRRRYNMALQASLAKSTVAPPKAPAERCPVILEAAEDAVSPSVPRYYVAKDGDCPAKPAVASTADSIPFRKSWQFCMEILSAMFVALVLAALGFLKMRDIH